MLKRFLTAFIVTTLVTGGYFYYLKSTGVQVANNNSPAKSANALETAAGASDISATVPFKLTNQDGKEVTEKDLAGKKLLVYFGFTHCPDVCPVSMAVLTEVMNQLQTAGIKNVQPVFISVDPENDTPAELKKYLKDYYSGFIALTGSTQEIEKVEKSFRVYAEKSSKAQGDKAATPASHSNLIYYMDENGKYQTHFTSENAPEDIVDYISSH